MAISNKAKVIGILGLGALALAANPNARAKVMTSIDKVVDNAVYPAPVENGTKYMLQPYTIRPGDTLIRIANGNYMVVDYIKDMNRIQRSGEIQPGEEIVVPVAVPQGAKYGRTISQLYNEFYSRR